MKIAYQGVQGSYSSLAAQRYFGMQSVLIGCSTSNEVCERIEKGEVDFGILPIENTVAGTFSETIDIMYAHTLYIVGESILRVEHMLMSTGELKDLKRVYTHPRVFDECSRFFTTNSQLEKINYSDTALAAQYVATLSPENGAIASKEAAELYGLTIIQQNIEDNPKNWTRFLILANKPETDTQQQHKVAIFIRLDNKPGTLYAMLGVLAQENINVTKLESRPVPESPFEYYFFLELALQPGIGAKKILHMIEEKTTFAKVVGSYNIAPLPHE